MLLQKRILLYWHLSRSITLNVRDFIIQYQQEIINRFPENKNTRYL